MDTCDFGIEKSYNEYETTKPGLLVFNCNRSDDEYEKLEQQLLSNSGIAPCMGIVFISSMHRCTIDSKVLELDNVTVYPKPLIKPPLLSSKLNEVLSGGMVSTKEDIQRHKTTGDQEVDIDADQENDCGFSVLVVEDNKINQKLMLNYLKKLSVKAEIAQNGQIAIEKSLKKSYDLIFMDCNMPVLDGFKAAQEIRAHEGPNQTTTIVALTANAMKSDIDKCRTAGMDNFLSKPISISHIRSVIESQKNKKDNDQFII